MAAARTHARTARACTWALIQEKEEEEKGDGKRERRGEGKGGVTVRAEASSARAWVAAHQEWRHVGGRVSGETKGEGRR